MRRYLRFRLVHVLALVTLVCLCSAYVFWWREAANRRCQVAARLTELEINWSVDGARDRPPDIQDRIAALLGIKDCRIEFIYGVGGHLTASERAEVIRSLRFFPETRHLRLDEFECTDADLAKLPCLAKLRYLSIGNAGITDNSIETILKCRELERLSLPRSRVSDQFVDRIAELPKLERLDISDTNVSIAGAERFHAARRDVKILAPNLRGKF